MKSLISGSVWRFRCNAKRFGNAWPIYRIGGVEQLQGRSGERFSGDYRNYSKSTTHEVVATVDGLGVLKGEPGRLRISGYVLPPGQPLRISGFRKGSSEVAAFRLSSAAES